MMSRKNKNDELQLLQMLDHVVTVNRHIERHNLPAQHMMMACGQLDTPMGTITILEQQPFPAIMRRTADAERNAFMRYGIERPWPAEHRDLLDALQGFLEPPIAYLENGFIQIGLQHDQCVVTLGTRGQPGWTNQSSFEPFVFEELALGASLGGVLVDFFDPFDRRFEPAPPPEAERSTSWWDIREEDVAEQALKTAKQPRDRLILLLAIYQRMRPEEISNLNLSQVRQKYGRDYKPRVYLKKRLVRRKAVAEALLAYRKRDRESYWDDKEPLFRAGSALTRKGRSKRMAAKDIEAFLERHAKRARKALPPKPEPEPEPPTPPPPMFWVADVTFMSNHEPPTPELR